MASVSRNALPGATRSAAPDKPGIRLALLLVLGPALSVVIWAMQLAGARVFEPFALGYLLLLGLAFPTKLLSPLSFVHIYYGVWYVLAPMFAQRYMGEFMDRANVQLALAYLFSGYVTCLLGSATTEWATREHGHGFEYTLPNATNQSLFFPILALYFVASLMVALIILNSGGLDFWLASPGDAFLTRQGTGVYVILSHFSSMLLAAFCGVQAYRRRQPMHLLAFVCWLLLTSPVHGSKFQIILLLVLALLPWLRDVRPLSGKSVFTGLCFVAIFILGQYFREHSFEISTFLPYALNYFTTLDNFAMSLADMGPGVLQTFFLPFNKLTSPVGVPDTSFYFNMNHVLTDIYFPHAWVIRATEQWPVEKDLYLNFGFFAGLPLLFGYLFALTVIHRWAERRDSLGLWFASVTLTLMLVSHLRGSLYNFNDFYMYPYLAVACYLLRKVSLRRPDSAPAPDAQALRPAQATG